LNPLLFASPALIARIAAKLQVDNCLQHPTSQPLVIGETFTIQSSVLREKRRINVYIPSAYSSSSDVRLPVLYMPDGGVDEDFIHVAGLVQVLVGNGTIRPFLLVGVENTERRRDLTGPTKMPRIGRSLRALAARRSSVRSFAMN